MAIEVKEGEYKGNPMFEFWNERSVDKPLFSFGLGKAKMIIDNFDAIKEFYEKNKKASS